MVLELALQMPSTLGYVGLTLAIPVFLTALISVACGLLFVLAAAVGISLDSRATTTLTIAPLVALVVWALQSAFGALRRRLPCGPVVTLSQVTERSLSVDEVGAKAHTLARLRERGARVAPGWVLRASVCDEVGDISSEATALAATVPKAALRRLHRELEASGESHFLLRSSFSGEDEEGLAAPGVYDSVTWARASGDKGLAAAIREVWASYWGTRAVAYRAGNGGTPRPRLAILAQPVVRHQRSGVAASVDLVQGGRDAHLIDAGDWQGRHALLTDRVDVLSDTLGGAPLSDASVRHISKLAGMAEVLLAAPAEVEWGIEGEQVTLYQARPLSGQALPVTVTHRHIVELPRYPLTPLSHSFLWGDGSPAEVLSAGMTALGLDALPERALVTVKGRVMLDVSAFKALAMGLGTASGLRSRTLLAALFGLTGQSRADAPNKPNLSLDGLTSASLVSKLNALQNDALRPRLARQMRALIVASSLDAWLESASDSGVSPPPRVSRPDGGDAWYRARREAELDCPRGAEGEAAGVDTDSGASSDAADQRGGLLLRWVAWTRDRQLTEREALNAEIQSINAQAREHALALDRRLSEAHDGWAEGDVFYCTLTELAAHVTAGGALPERGPRRVRFSEDDDAQFPGLCELDAFGEVIARPTLGAGEGALLTGIAIGKGAFSGRLCVIGEGSEAPVDDARDSVLLLEGGSPRWSPHVMVAKAVVLLGAGPLSHLALLARERGIPVLAAASGEHDGLVTGEPVTCDLDGACLRREG